MDNVAIQNPQKLAETKNIIKKDRASTLHILADFDRTLTHAFVNGESVPSILSILRDGNYLTPDYAEKANALFSKYHAIEIDHAIPLEERKKAMQEWWTKHFELLIKSGLNKSDIGKVVKSGKVKFRDGFGEFMDILHNNNVPIVIISSSGLGIDSIKLAVESTGKLYDNVFIVSNSFRWNDVGSAVSVNLPIIHVLNKNETSLKNFPFYSAIKDRKNVLLLGDNLEDVGMVEGFEYDNLISVGFLNEKVDENLERYKKVYDIVIVNDGSLEPVNQLLKEIL